MPIQERPPEKQTVSIKSTFEVPELFRLGTDIQNLELPDVLSVGVEELPPAPMVFWPIQQISARKGHVSRPF